MNSYYVGNGSGEYMIAIRKIFFPFKILSRKNWKAIWIILLILCITSLHRDIRVRKAQILRQKRFPYGAFLFCMIHSLDWIRKLTDTWPELSCQSLSSNKIFNFILLHIYSLQVPLQHNYFALCRSFIKRVCVFVFI